MSFFKKLKDPKNLAICGLFIALYIVTAFTNISISALIQIRFGFIVLAVAGLYGGPMMGLVVGGIGDILSFIATGGQGGTYFPGFTLSYALMGLLFGLIFFRTKITIPRVIAASVVDFLISVFMNSKWISIFSGNSYGSMILLRLPKCSIMLVINAILLYICIKAVYNALRKSQLLIN